MSVSLQVVYVNYRSVDLLTASARSVLDAAAALGDVECELTVVDNTCDAREVERLRAALPAGVQVLAAPDNLGFAAGCNLGAAAGRGDHLLFLNPDTEMPGATLRGLVDALEGARGRAVVGPRHYADRELRFAHAPMRGVRLFDAARDVLHDRGFAPRRSLRDLAFRARLARSRGPVPLRAVSGACLAIPRPLFDALGGWDARYFLYSEDTDLCVRARRAGAPVLYLPELPFVHRIEGSARHAAGRVAAARTDGRALFKRTHYGAALAGLDRLVTGALGRGLPRLGDRWRAAAPLPAARALRAPSAGAPWAVELGRSPLFDNCLTAFPDGPVIDLPESLIAWLPAGTYFVRVAVEERPGRWRETALYRHEARPAAALQEAAS